VPHRNPGPNKQQQHDPRCPRIGIRSCARLHGHHKARAPGKRGTPAREIRQVVITQDDNGQGLLGFIEADRETGKRATGYKYAVLVTNLEHERLTEPVSADTGKKG
jgi:hypothetical protein